MILQIVGAFVAMYWFAALIETPKKYLPMAGVVASIGWFVYLSCENLGAEAVLATFFSALTVTFISHVLARKVKTPVTIFLIAGIIPTVPGATMYRIAYYVILGDNDMSIHYLMEMFKIAGAIAVAIFIVDSIFRIYYRNLGKRSNGQ